ncbi:MAG: hypothetical protein DRJ09_03225 [Bacteroidetes bacterium]|nr:MAG: hypothetical protein DRJ09_03225 [Bacteroidota bacterium]
MIGYIISILYDFNSVPLSIGIINDMLLNLLVKVINSYTMQRSYLTKQKCFILVSFTRLQNVEYLPKDSPTKTVVNYIAKNLFWI